MLSWVLLNYFRNFNLAKATKMLHETVEWRRHFEIPKLMNEFKATIAVENATGKMYVRGFDKEGHALIYMKPVRENTKSHEGNIKHLVYSMERAVACMEARGEGRTKLSLVIDYDGYTNAHSPTMKTSKETLHILQNHYPERLKCAYCIRAPMVFYVFFKMVSPFIDPVTKKKISMLKNAEIGTEVCQLMKEVDASVLETCVGGTDARPFHSATYLAAPFTTDFNQVLNDKERAAALPPAPPAEAAATAHKAHSHQPTARQLQAMAALEAAEQEAEEEERKKLAATTPVVTTSSSVDAADLLAEELLAAELSAAEKDTLAMDEAEAAAMMEAMIQSEITSEIDHSADPSA